MNRIPFHPVGTAGLSTTPVRLLKQTIPVWADFAPAVDAFAAAAMAADALGLGAGANANAVNACVEMRDDLAVVQVSDVEDSGRISGSVSPRFGWKTTHFMATAAHETHRKSMKPLTPHTHAPGGGFAAGTSDPGG
jgi:hypothetical protein